MRLKFIVASLLFSHFLMAQPSQDGIVIDRIIAKVDDFIVLKSELERSYLDYLSQGSPRSQEAKCQILESLIVNKMLVARAEIDSVMVEDAEVNSNLDQRMGLIMQNVGGSREELEKAYGKTLEQIRSELFDIIKEQMLIQRMQTELTVDMEVSPREVKKFFNNIPADSLPYFSTEVKVAQIVMKPEPNSGQVEKIRQQMMRMREQILSGTSFASLARRYSEDGSANNGGELPYYKRGEVAPEFEASAMTLEVGELSEPIKTQFGFHLIQLIERRGNTFKTRHILMSPKPATEDFEKAEYFLDSLRTQILADSVKFQKAAKDHSDDQFTASNGGFFADAETGSLSVSIDELSPDIFFAIDTMKIGNITKPFRFQQQDGSYAYRILYYKDKVPPHLANLEDDYQKIATAALNQKRNKLLNEWFLGAQEGIFIEIDPEYDNCDLLEE
jgi:peptidyl-prolyl cis-trans isomerase SurA